MLVNFWKSLKCKFVFKLLEEYLKIDNFTKNDENWIGDHNLHSLNIRFVKKNKFSKYFSIFLYFFTRNFLQVSLQLIFAVSYQVQLLNETV